VCGVQKSNELNHTKVGHRKIVLNGKLTALVFSFTSKQLIFWLVDVTKGLLRESQFYKADLINTNTKLKQQKEKGKGGLF
jgi:hypothetical protein